MKGAKPGTRGHASVWLRVSPAGRATGALECLCVDTWAGLCVELYKFFPLLVSEKKKKGHFARNSTLAFLAEW